MLNVKVLILIGCLAFLSGHSQSLPHANAHAHNDYEHDRPLFDALENGFTSIEADVHLKGGQLLVAHNVAGPKAKTLQALYLDPLDSISRHNQGHIYRHYEGPVILLIDIKTEAEPTYRALLDVLSGYPDLIHTPSRPGAIQIVISGNRPIDLIRGESTHSTAIDGRPQDLGTGFSVSEMPLISENYTKVSKWKGDGSPPPEEVKKLTDLAQRVHAENKRLRLWQIPDHKNAWDVLLKAGIDIINTDKLKELNVFLSTQKK